MSNAYQLIEDVKPLKNLSHYNAYKASNRVHFIKIDDATEPLKKLVKKYNKLNAVSMQFGLLGVLLFYYPLKNMKPALDEQREVAKRLLRDIPPYQLETLSGYHAESQEIRFEEKRKGVRVHVGNKWLLFDTETSQNLYAQLK